MKETQATPDHAAQRSVPSPEAPQLTEAPIALPSFQHPSLRPSQVRRLQRSLGNQSLQRMLQRAPVIQRNDLHPTLNIVDLSSNITAIEVWNQYQQQTAALKAWTKQRDDYNEYLAELRKYEEIQAQSAQIKAEAQANMAGPQSAAVPSALAKMPAAPPSRKDLFAAMRQKSSQQSLKRLNIPAPDPVDKPVGTPPEVRVAWVQLQDLYTAVTQVGNESWPPIVKDRVNAEKDADKSLKFVIYTGLHGNIGGQFLDDDGNISGRYRDVKHTKQDIDGAAALVNEYAQQGIAVDIRVIDIFQHAELLKPEQLKAHVKASIGAGRVAILAWCYSLEAFKAVPDTVIEQPQGQEHQTEVDYVGARNELKVTDIIIDRTRDD